MTKQFPALSALTLVGSPTTSLRTQYSSALEPRNFFLLVADIYRRISFAATKIRELLLSSQVLCGLESVSLRGEIFTAVNKKINANFRPLLVFKFFKLSKKGIPTNSTIIISFLKFVLLVQRTKTESLCKLNTNKGVN